MPNLPWVEAIKARYAASSQVEWALDEDYELPDAIFIAAAHNTDIPRLFRAVEVLGEAVEKSAARVFEPDEFADEDDLWTCEECGGSWATPVEEAHAEWCTVGIARRALADVQSLPSAPGATEE